MRTALVSIVLAVALSCAGPALEARVVQELEWRQAPEGALLVPAAAGRAAWLRIERAQPGTIALLRLDQPALRSTTWALKGEVRCQGLQGRAFLEMWSVFADGKRYFTRTLAPAGPMADLRGTSDWRPFAVPFASRPGLPAPVALELNVVFEGTGAVELGALRLEEYEPGEDPLIVGAGRAWWNDRRGALIGAIGGSLIGLLGALVGWLGSRGRAARFVMTLMGSLAAAGVLVLGAGVFALYRAQPYAVWYPLVLGGAVLTIVTLGGYPRLHARYRQLELRRMQALDTR